MPEQSRERLLELFKELKHPVALHLFGKEGVNDLFQTFARRFLADLARLTPLIGAHFHGPDDPLAAQYGVTSFPTLLVEPERYRIRFSGAPLGEEGRSFLEALLMASRRDSGLAEASRKALAELDQPRTVQVFVTPTCPYCPAQVVNAFRCAVERPDLVSASCVEIGQMPQLAQVFNVGSVPHTVYDNTLQTLGMEPEAQFVARLVTLRDASAHQAPTHAPGETIHVDCLILGAGPAGLTAGIYGGRAGLNCLILERAALGGQVSLTPVVENYPGYVNVAGLALTEIMAAQARQYCEIIQDPPLDVRADATGFTARTASLTVTARALILATGATWRKLGVPGEVEFFGHGVNYCATCDGYLYKGRKALVVGGGNTALTDALYLKNLGVDVTVVHRRDAFRAEKHLQDAVARADIPLLMNSRVEAILGTDKASGVRLRDAATGQTREEPTDAVFVAVGETPNTEQAVALGCALTKDGSIAVDARMRTSVPGVYAAGDVTGGIRQIVTAVGQGASAALAVFEDLAGREGAAASPASGGIATDQLP
uniref:Thioredoxin reductase n=1 Tax=Fundidesulfovibrio putealis TaxID=270496 RepID=A0A7C3WJM3_9BACT